MKLLHQFVRIFFFPFILFASFPTWGPGANLLVNPDLEEEPVRWTFSPQDHGQTQVLTEAARNGEYGLSVTGNGGSSLYSRWIPVQAGETYQLRFWARQVEAGGIAVYILFFDEHKRRIDPADQFFAGVPGSATEWTEIVEQSRAPERAVYMALWVHSYSRSTGVTYLDDFSLTLTPRSQSGE